MEEENAIFPRQKLIRLLVPLFIEQILAVTISIADTMMVASCGETAVSAVSLVAQINILIIYMFSALAAGGAVVSAQYIGRKDLQNARITAKQLLYLCTAVSTVIAVVIVSFRGPLLGAVYGNIEKDVMDSCKIYLFFTAIDYPFIAIYNTCAALFRSNGNSRVSMLISTLMNGINMAGNAYFIYVAGLGVAGAAIATLISRIVGATIILSLMLRPRDGMYIEKVYQPVVRWDMIKRILKIGVPNGMENSMFQFGKLIVASMITTFGTSAIAANAVCNNISTFAIMPGTAIGLGMVTVVGQCVGAEEYGQAIKYTRKLMTYMYIGMFIMNMTIFFAASQVLRLYNLSPEAYAGAYHILRIYTFISAAIWPIAFGLPNALRASGDTRFTMVISIVSMWVFRIGCSYLLALGFGLKLDGVWFGMYIDWVFRSSIFILRFARGKWKEKRVI